MLNDYTLGDQTIADRRARGQAPEPFTVNEDWDEPCCDPDLRPDCHECGHEFDAPCCCVNDVPACHQGCTMCWNDLLRDQRTDHACTCDACTPRLPSDHRWTESCSCSNCVPA